jgi:hypothetical protein
VSRIRSKQHVKLLTPLMLQPWILPRCHYRRGDLPGYLRARAIEVGLSPALAVEAETVAYTIKFMPSNSKMQVMFVAFSRDFRDL